MSGEAYDINKQTIHIAPKSNIKSRAHYAPEPTRGIRIRKMLKFSSTRLSTLSPYLIFCKLQINEITKSATV